MALNGFKTSRCYSSRDSEMLLFHHLAKSMCFPSGVFVMKTLSPTRRLTFHKAV